MMDVGAFHAGRAGYAVAIGVPMAVLALVWIPPSMIQARIERDLLARQTLLTNARQTERAIIQAASVVTRIESSPRDEGDRPAELDGFAGKAARGAGVVVQEITVRRRPASPDGCHVDFAVAVHGESTVPALARFIDRLERGQRMGVVASVLTRVRTLQPEPLYETDLTFVCRDVRRRETTVVAQARPAVPGVLCGAGVREEIGTALAGVRATLEGAQRELSVAGLVRKRAPLVVEPSHEGIEPARPMDEAPVVTLHGIVRNAAMPLALTDDGVKAVGDSIGEWEVKTIGTDQIVLVGPRGMLCTVRLYREAKP